MRHVRIAGAFLSLLVLVRCGPTAVPAGVPELQPRLNSVPTPEIARAPHPRAIREAVSVPNATVDEVESEVPYPADVRELTRRLGMPGCGRMILIDDETGLPLPNQEPWQVKELRLLGESVHAAYEMIWADPKSTWAELTGVGIALDYTPAEPRRFVPFAIRRLTLPDALLPVDPNPKDGTPEIQVQRLEFHRRLIREEAMRLLVSNGDERDAWVLVPFLYANDWSLRRAAAGALAEIGGHKELEALNTWLTLQIPNDPRVPKFKKLRDEMETRLSAKVRRGF